MPLAQRSERLRQRLLGLLAEVPDPHLLVERLGEIRERESVAPCSELVRLLVNLELDEPQSERVLRDVLQHRRQLADRLGRDPGVHVAAIDWFSNIDKRLRNPTVMEMSAFETIERSAVTDALTGLFNRGYFRRALTREIRRGLRYEAPVSVLMLDLDHFKSVNDAYGHMFGDLVLKRVGALLRRTVREADVPCRYGGEELAVILPETGRLGAYTVGERIRRDVAHGFAERPTAGRRVALTVSGGVATWPDDGDEEAALISRADENLYQAKHAGRNRIDLFPGDRRRAVRYPFKASARVGVRAAGRPRPAVGVDLSVLGAQIRSEGELPERTSVELSLDSGEPSDTPWEVGGRIVRVEPEGRGSGIRAGVAFDRPMPRERMLRHVDAAGTRRPVGGPRGPA